MKTPVTAKIKPIVKNGIIGTVFLFDIFIKTTIKRGIAGIINETSGTAEQHTKSINNKQITLSKGHHALTKCDAKTIMIDAIE